MGRVKRLGLGSFAAMLMCTGLLISSARAQDKAADKSKAESAASSTKPADQKTPEKGYVGSDTCKTCHEDVFNGYEKSPHYKTLLDPHATASKQGCEGCHGPGEEHTGDPADKTKIFGFKGASTEKINSKCLTCHAAGPQQMNSANSLHRKNDVSCISCHSPHHAQSKESLLVKSQPELCYSCHLQQKPQFNMPFHHRVNEGFVQCTDCHNPHGTVKPKQVRTSATQDAVCFTCHIDKQGPFVFEHMPVKTEGCASCHTPHGSPNPHMLKVSNVNLLCLQCHTTSSFSGAPGTPSFHNQAAQYQACTLCHSQIHGSNVDRTFFK